MNLSFHPLLPSVCLYAHTIIICISKTQPYSLLLLVCLSITDPHPSLSVPVCLSLQLPPPILCLCLLSPTCSPPPGMFLSVCLSTPSPPFSISLLSLFQLSIFLSLILSFGHLVFNFVKGRLKISLLNNFTSSYLRIYLDHHVSSLNSLHICADH